MSRLITTETTEQARARINRQLIAQGGVPHSAMGALAPRTTVGAAYMSGARNTARRVEAAIEDMDRALDAAKNAVSRCKALGVIN